MLFCQLPFPGTSCRDSALSFWPSCPDPLAAVSLACSHASASAWASRGHLPWALGTQSAAAAPSRPWSGSHARPASWGAEASALGEGGWPGFGGGRDALVGPQWAGTGPSRRQARERAAGVGRESSSSWPARRAPRGQALREPEAAVRASLRRTQVGRRRRDFHSVCRLPAATLGVTRGPGHRGRAGGGTPGGALPRAGRIWEEASQVFPPSTPAKLTPALEADRW